MDEQLKNQIRKARGKFLMMGTTYALGVFNDNFFKQAAILLAVGMDWVKATIAILFSIPFIIFASHVGWLADRFPKRNIVIFAKALEVVAMLIGAAGILMVNWWLILAMVFIMAAQSAIFSPSLNGSIPELYPPSHVITANAILKVFVTVAMLGGVVLAGPILGNKNGGSQGEGRMWIAIAVVLIALLGLAASLFVPKRPAASPDAPMPVNGLAKTFRDIVGLRADRLLAIVVGLDVFIWFIGMFLVLVVSDLGQQQMPKLLGVSAKEFTSGEEIASYLTFAELIGVAVGGGISAAISQGDRWRRVLVPATIAMGCAAFMVCAVPLVSAAVVLPLLYGGLFAFGVFGGMVLIPCEGFIQIRPAAERKGTVIAAANCAAFIGIALSGLVYYVSIKLLSPTSCFAVMGVLSVTAALVVSRFLRGIKAK